MASIELINVRAALKKAHEEIDKAFAPILNAAAEADSEEENEEVKLTPVQKLNKQLETAQEKLTKLNAKIAEGKSKTKDKDEENKAKFEEVISKIREKISEAEAKEAKKAEPKPAKAAAKKPAKAAEEAEKPAPAEEKSEAKKNVPRITPAMTTKLKEAFEAVGAVWDDKYKKEFVTEVNSLSEKQFGDMTLEGHVSHMSHFANKHAPAAAGGGGGGAAPKPKLKTLTVAELVKQNKNLKQVSAGVFQHKTTGEMVTGPAEDADEEFEDKDHDDVTYIVGQTTKRVYKPSDDGPDEFVGYWGVGDW
jgi:DNA repair exonuclease SbcCD ATPase subunit